MVGSFLGEHCWGGMGLIIPRVDVPFRVCALLGRMCHIVGLGWALSCWMSKDEVGRCLSGLPRAGLCHSGPDFLVQVGANEQHQVDP